jgi:hypothetical protein
MTFPQFVDFLVHGLFVPKISLFDDKSEGKTADLNVLWDYRDAEDDGDVSPELKEKYDRFKASLRWAKEWTYASCWHNSSEDCYAMWKLYGQHNEAIAIHTTLDNLITAFSKTGQLSSDVYARINYITYDSKLYPKSLYESHPVNHKIAHLDDPEYMSIFDAFFTKHIAYSYEKEVRLIMSHDKSTSRDSVNVEGGFTLQFDNKLINEVHVSPNAPEWFAGVVCEVMDKFDMDNYVRLSDYATDE